MATTNVGAAEHDRLGRHRERDPPGGAQPVSDESSDRAVHEPDRTDGQHANQCRRHADVLGVRGRGRAHSVRSGERPDIRPLQGRAGRHARRDERSRENEPHRNLRGLGQPNFSSCRFPPKNGTFSGTFTAEVESQVGNTIGGTFTVDSRGPTTRVPFSVTITPSAISSRPRSGSACSRRPASSLAPDHNVNGSDHGRHRHGELLGTNPGAGELQCDRFRDRHANLFRGDPGT